MSSVPQDITERLLRWSDGDQQALDELMPIVYGELRHIAGRFLNQERADHTLQPTALVLDETAEALGVSMATVVRDWALAKAWLHREIIAGGP